MRALIYYFTFAVDVVTLFLLYNAQFERRVKPVAYWSVVVFGGIAYWNALIYIGIPTVNLLSKLPINVVWALCVAALYKGPWLQRILVATIHHIILMGIDVFLYGLMVYLSGYTLHDVLGNAPLSAFLAALCHIILFAIFFSLAKLLRSHREQLRIPIWEWLSILLIVASAVIQLYINIFSLLDNASASPFIPIQAAMLLCVNISLLLLFDKLATRSKVQQENLALQEQMRYNRLSMQAATQSYDAQRSLTHDFDNHLLTVVQLLQQGQSEEALAYAQAVRGSVSKVDVAVSTNNPIADAVLGQKYRKAQELGVQMQFLVSDLASFPLVADEMATVLANLLDNAIEACVRDSSMQKKSIRVKLLVEPALATLSVQNTSLPVEISHEGEVATTKQKQSEHGYGLKTCKKILHHAGFDFAIQYKDGWFQFTAIKAL